MLNILGGFWSSKTIKLSDAFGVFINGSDEYLINCTGFTLPKLEFKEETQLYGNTGQTFLIPNYESATKLTLDFYEETSNKLYNFIEKYLNLTLTQKFDDYGLALNYGTYNKTKIQFIDIKIADNRLSKWIYKYHFDNLKIIDYSLYDLDYQNESPCKISITFGFEGYYAEDINEIINYAAPGEEISTTNTKPDTISPNDEYVASEETIKRNDDDLSMADELLSRVLTGDIGTNNNWIINAKQEGYTSAEINYASNNIVNFAENKLKSMSDKINADNLAADQAELRVKNLQSQIDKLEKDKAEAIVEKNKRLEVYKAEIKQLQAKGDFDEEHTRNMVSWARVNYKIQDIKNYDNKLAELQQQIEKEINEAKALRQEADISAKAKAEANAFLKSAKDEQNKLKNLNKTTTNK